MASSRLLLDNILCSWASILVIWLALQQYHCHNQVVGFEYIQWKEFKSRDDADLGIALPRSSEKNETTNKVNGTEKENGIEKDNGTSSNNPKTTPRVARKVDFYLPYENRHNPVYAWNKEAVGKKPLPIERLDQNIYWYPHHYTARNSLFPSQSLLILKDKEGKAHACGCAHLHPDLIITTRRCIESKVAAKVVIRRTLQQAVTKEYPTEYAFVKGFCVLDKNSRDYENDVAVGFLETSVDFKLLVWPAAAVPDDGPPVVQYAGIVREGTINGYNLLEPGCSKSSGGDGGGGAAAAETSRACYTTTDNGSRHICEGVDNGMGLYHLTSVQESNGGSALPRIYLAGLMSQAEQGAPGCRTDTAEGQWVNYVDFKKIPRLKEMITKCYS